MSLRFPEPLIKRVTASGVVAVVVLDTAEQAEPLARALEKGGIRAAELTLRTAGALDALHAFRQCAPDFLLGAGTVLRPEQVAQVAEAGVDFAVAPGTGCKVLEAAQTHGIPFAPGIATPSDIEAALEYDCNVLKFFPAESMGGVKFLRTMSAPYRHLNLHYIPLGGLSEGSIPAYIAEPGVAALGGSWIAPHDLIGGGQWDEITLRASRAVAAIKQHRHLS